MHELGPEPTFNESMYFNAIDPTTQLGAFFRLGNRANEGRGEMTCCVYLPDGRVAFMFQRPEVRTNDAFDAAGMSFEVIEPFEELEVRYDGTVIVMDDPLAMADPRRAFTEHTPVPCTVALSFRGVCAPFGGEPEVSHEREGEEFARGHYEQLVSAEGSISIDDEEWELSGFGLRDHSWGPRTWQAPFYYRWLTANFGPDLGFMASRIARRDSDGVRAGFVWDGESVVPTKATTVATDWAGTDRYHEVIRTEFRSALEGDDRSWTVTGEVLSLIPLRNRRDGMVTRISEGLTRWTTSDGRVGYGLSEYLDQIVDGAPVGLDE
jgi:hypothetical protein